MFIAEIQALVQLHSPVSFTNGSISQSQGTEKQGTAGSHKGNLTNEAVLLIAVWLVVAIFMEWKIIDRFSYCSPGWPRVHYTE